MSEKQTYTKEEVKEMLTLLFHAMEDRVFGRSSHFEWEAEHGSVSGSCVEEINLFGTLYGQMMSVIESSVEEKKVEPAKAIARQLFRGTKHLNETVVFDMFKNIIKNTPNVGFGGEWEKLKKQLNKD